jgi:chromosome segregation ATPase
MSVKEFWGTIGRKLTAFKKACIRTWTPYGETDRGEPGASRSVDEPPSRYESEADAPPPAMAEPPKSGKYAQEHAAASSTATASRETEQNESMQSESSQDQPSRTEPPEQTDRSDHESVQGDQGERGLSVRAREDELAGRPVIDPDDLRELMDALRTLPESMTSLSTALREQLALPGQIAQALEKFRESGMEDEILESMRDLATEAKNQTDCLQGIQQSMHTAEQTQQKVIASLAQLNEATETNNRATASQAELMEQVRDHLSNANNELREQVEAHTNQLKKLGIIGAIILVVGMAAMIAAILMK